MQVSNWRVALTIHFVFMTPLVISMTGCGSEGAKSCPAGTYEWQGSCVPTSNQDIQATDWRNDKASSEDPAADVEAPPDVPDGGADADAEVVDAGPEDIPSDFVAQGQIGSPCSAPGDCQSGLDCMAGWVGGYCTVAGCVANADCPAGSACLTLEDGYRSCLAVCTEHAQCRTGDGFRCKQFDAPEGGSIGVCFGTAEEAHPLGGPCESHESCAGELFCDLSFSHGYCSRRHCGVDDPCPGGACVRVAGVPTCLKSCATDDDCRWLGDDFDLVCQGFKDVAQDDVKVCVSSVSGEPLGSVCLNSFECDLDSDLYCHELRRGVCASNGGPCLSDAQCLETSDLCLETEAYRFGICAKACSQSTPCPGTARCLSSDGLTGFCSPACLSHLTCPGDDVMRCVFGEPLSTEPDRACFTVLSGGLSASCFEGGDCQSGLCFGVDGHAGYCSSECPQQLWSVCPFPTACATWQGLKRCLVRCEPGNDDCPTGFICDKPSGDSKYVCLPI